ncbi:MAG: hypothetical protein AAGB27_15690 [Pseudomonadota bacterium]
MSPVIFSALLALAAADKEAADKERSAQAESKQILTTVTLSDSPSAAKKSAMKARGVVEHPAPTMPPLVAFVKPDGTLGYRHGNARNDVRRVEKRQ